MKRKILFKVSIGSQLPTLMSFTEASFPSGGEEAEISVEFESDNVNPMKDAFKALKDKIVSEHGDIKYHVWYWTWLDEEK